MSSHESSAVAPVTDVPSSAVRYVARQDAPGWPFVWRGLLPLLGLLALGWYGLVPFARLGIEAPVREAARAALQRGGFDRVQLNVSGQHVLLAGQPPSEGAGARALDAVRAATCPTWVGPLTCHVDVIGSFDSPARAPAGPAATADAGSAAATACEAELAELLRGAQVRFETGKADITPESEPLLDRLAKAARQCPGVVRVEGHTDSRGEPEANRALSQARAVAVMQALVVRGMPPGRLKAQGFGAERPIQDNATAQGRAANRRIELRAETPR